MSTLISIFYSIYLFTPIKISVGGDGMSASGQREPFDLHGTNDSDVCA